MTDQRHRECMAHLSISSRRPTGYVCVDNDAFGTDVFSNPRDHLGRVSDRNPKSRSGLPK
ncbi:MAG: hypothetical protein OXB92_09790 [Acidimicrobiaceae bacterium]|nr:hypothetical protein [Acidimicrobiaceae bacterium]